MWSAVSKVYLVYLGFMCTAVLNGWDPATPPPPRIGAHMWGRYWSAKILRRRSLCDPLIDPFLLCAVRSGSWWESFTLVVSGSGPPSSGSPQKQRRMIPPLVRLHFPDPFLPVLGIRIRKIRMFLGLPDPEPDPLVRGIDPDLHPSHFS